jgi:fructoselysine-6-P-deglycase FrlB-like protein
VTAGTGTLLAICSNSTGLAHEEKMAQEAAVYGAQILAVVANQGFEQARWRFTLNGDYPVEAVALHFVFILQSLAYHIAVHRGLDPDHPGDLVSFIQI